MSRMHKLAAGCSVKRPFIRPCRRHDARPPLVRWFNTLYPRPRDLLHLTVTSPSKAVSHDIVVIDADGLVARAQSEVAVGVAAGEWIRMSCGEMLMIPSSVGRATQTLEMTSVPQRRPTPWGIDICTPEATALPMPGVGSADSQPRRWPKRLPCLSGLESLHSTICLAKSRATIHAALVSRLLNMTAFGHYWPCANANLAFYQWTCIAQ